MDVNMTIYNLATGGVAGKASQEGIHSQLPGRENGPSDAYRHLLLSAELTRQYGENYARMLLEGHEWTGNMGDQQPDAEAMDRHNNQIGIEIGIELRNNPNSSWEDVINMVRGKFDPNDNNGDGAQWLPSDRWQKNPVADGQRMPNDDPRLNWPPTWPDGPFAPDNSDGGHYDGDYDSPSDIIPDFFNAARNWVPPRYDPLALDLDGDGIETIGVNGAVLFDHDGDGVQTATGWVKADDGLLVLDRNGNGKIDTGAELFGVDTVLANGQKATNGFAALRDLDASGDNVFDVHDTRFADVRIWRDLSQDGITQAGELFTLQSLGIAALNLNATNGAVNLGNGNVQTASAAYVRTDGTTGEAAGIGLCEVAANLEFAQNPFYRQFTDVIPLTEQASLLPQMRGSGMVRDLREAA